MGQTTLIYLTEATQGGINNSNLCKCTTELRGNKSIEVFFPSTCEALRTFEARCWNINSDPERGRNLTPAGKRTMRPWFSQCLDCLCSLVFLSHMHISCFLNIKKAFFFLHAAVQMFDIYLLACLWWNADHKDFTQTRQKIWFSIQNCRLMTDNFLCWRGQRSHLLQGKLLKHCVAFWWSQDFWDIWRSCLLWQHNGILAWQHLHYQRNQ